MPSKRFTTRLDDGTKFQYDWDEEQEGPRTRKGILSKYEASKIKNEPEGVEDKGFIADLWDRANASFLPDLPPVPGGVKTATDRALDWGYSRLIQPAASPMGVATLPAAAFRAGRIGLAGLGTVMGAANIKPALEGAIQDPTAESMGDLALTGLGLAAFPLGAKAGAFKRKPLTAKMPMSSTIDPTDMGNSSLVDPPILKRGPELLDIKLEDILPPEPTGADSRGFFTLPEKKVPIMPSQTGQFRLGVDAPVNDPTGSGLSVPRRMMAPSPTQNVLESMIPSALREKVGGVKHGVDVNDTILPAFPDDPGPPKVVQAGERVPDKPPITVLSQDELYGRDPMKDVAKKHPELGKAAAQVVEDRKNTIAEKTAEIEGRRSKQRGLGKAAKDTYDQVAKSGTAILDSLGDAGKELSTLLKRTRAEGSIAAGDMSNKIRKIIEPLDKQTWDAVVDHMEGKAISGEPVIVKTAGQLSKLLDDLGIEAESSGMEMRVPSGQTTKFKRMEENYFPHEFESGYFEKNADSIRSELLKKGMSAQEIDIILKGAVEGGPRLISPQHMRSLNLEGYRRDKGALYKHVDDMYKRLYESKNLGARDIGDESSAISALIAKTDNPELAAQIVKGQLGRNETNPSMAKVANTVNKFEAAVKLPLFAVSNMSQAAAPLLRGNMSSFAKGVMDTFKGNDFAEQSGALQQVLRSSFQEMGGENMVSKAYGMSKSEQLNRSLAANTGKHEVGRAFNALKKNPKDDVARSRLQDLLLENVDDVLKQEVLTDKQRQMAGFRMSEITQGITDPMDLPPIWSAHPLMKLPTMLKRFAFQQTKIIRDAIKENPKRNIPIATALYTAMGEAVGDTKAVIGGMVSGEDISDRIDARGEGIDRLARNLADGFAFGILSDLMSEESVPGQRLQWLAGPAISDAVGMLNAGNKARNEMDIMPVVEEGVRKLPMGYQLGKRFKSSDKSGRAGRPTR